MNTWRLVKHIGLFAAGVLVLLGTAAMVMPSAQSKDVDSAQALKELAAEVRGLRTVIERYTDGQARVETVTNVLAVQQSRLSDLNARLDTARRELAGQQDRLRGLASEIEAMESGRVTEKEARFAAESPAASRAKFEQVVGFIKGELERFSIQEQQTRNRESELQTALASEEAKWNDLQATLDSWLKR